MTKRISQIFCGFSSVHICKFFYIHAIERIQKNFNFLLRQTYTSGYFLYLSVLHIKKVKIYSYILSDFCCIQKKASEFLKVIHILDEYRVLHWSWYISLSVCIISLVNILLLAEGKMQFLSLARTLEILCKQVGTRQTGSKGSLTVK